MSQALLEAIAALDGSEHLIAFTNGMRVGYALLGDQWITFEETPQGGRNQYFHPDAYAAYTYLRSLGLGDSPFQVLES